MEKVGRGGTPVVADALLWKGHHLEVVVQKSRVTTSKTPLSNRL